MGNFGGRTVRRTSSPLPGANRRAPRSFSGQSPGAAPRAAGAEFQDFLGDIVISVESARRNARQEGHPLRNEIRWLILHGVLHLLGYDHARDNGEMTLLELALRERMAVSGGRKSGGLKPRRS